MFEVGFTEIVLILGLALLVLGPEKLPGLAQKVGRWTGRARAMARQLRTQLEHEVTMEELSKSRPMQSASTPAEPAAPSEAQSAHSAGLDLDAAHAGVDPHEAPAPSGETDAATPPKQ
jgi:sec-independent protein translocase protein TatB